MAFGVALLLPWNATMATMDYFIGLYPGHKPSFSFLVAVSVPMLVMQIMAFAMALPAKVMLLGALILNSCVAAGIAVVPQLSMSEDAGYYSTLGLMVLQGTGIAFLQSSLYGLAGVSQKLTNNLMLGIGVGNVAVNLIRIMFMATVARQ